MEHSDAELTRIPIRAVGDHGRHVGFVDGNLDVDHIGSPELVLEMPQAYDVPAAGTVDYQYVILPYKFTEDRWVQASEVRPGARSVVHHVIAFIRESRKTENGLLPKDRYAGDINEQVYSLNSNSACWRGLRDMAAVLEDVGEKDAGAIDCATIAPSPIVGWSASVAGVVSAGIVTVPTTFTGRAGM